MSTYGGRSPVWPIARATAIGPAFESFFFSRKTKWKCGENCSQVDFPKMWPGKLEKAVFLPIFDNFGKYASIWLILGKKPHFGDF